MVLYVGPGGDPSTSHPVSLREKKVTIFKVAPAIKWTRVLLSRLDHKFLFDSLQEFVCELRCTECNVEHLKTKHLSYQGFDDVHIF